MILNLQWPPVHRQQRHRQPLASPAQRHLLLRKLSNRALRLPRSTPTERNGGIVSPASTRKERGNPIMHVDRPPSSIICASSTTFRSLKDNKSGRKSRRITLETSLHSWPMKLYTPPRTARRRQRQMRLNKPSCASCAAATLSPAVFPFLMLNG